jgi:hypothetical protein
MQTEEQVRNFENALTAIAKNPDENNLSAYHLTLEGQCQEPEVMFGLIHFLEYFDMKTQISAFIHVIPQLIITAPEWTRIIHNRILNHESACQVYQNLLHSANLNSPHFLYHLLKESIMNKLQVKESVLT